MQMLRISRALPDRQLILLCGRNEALRERLMRSDAELPRRHIALGYTEQVAQVLRLGDYFIGKPGPGALSEALHCGLPAVTFDGLGLMPQERYNTQWLREQGLGVVLRSVGQVREGVDDLLADLPVYRERVARLQNRAVHEVPAILDALLQTGAETSRELRHSARDTAWTLPARSSFANSYRVKP
jgi:UDP-N-acetylglucosamine:LPS N-acetylglucosamine transferase